MLESAEEIKRWCVSRRREVLADSRIKKDVLAIIKRVEEGRDQALRELAHELDGVTLKDIGIDVHESPDWKDDPLYRSLQELAARIREVSKSQHPGNELILRFNGYDICIRYFPYKKIGIYVPGGKEGYPSTLLMCAIPARVAGVREIIVCTPKPTRGIMMASHIAGIPRIYTLGGAQAIAAMAMGTLSVPRVEKIVGPGNVYVTEAKLALRDQVLIDMPAGPSEMVILADTTSNPEYIALDLLAQAEHGLGGMCLCISTSAPMARRVERGLAKYLKRLENPPRWLRSNIALGVVKDIDSAVELINELAPEHVGIMCADAETISRKIVNAGTVCIGKHSAAAFTDYSSGLNHVLPTGGYAKIRGGLSVFDFLRQVQYLHVTDPSPLVTSGIEIARAERFLFHETSMKKRKGRR